MLDTLLVCPVCQGALPLDTIRAREEGACKNCGRHFSYGERTFDLIPHPPPHQGVRRKWETWQQLQENGLAFYTEDPAHNLSVGDRADVAAFAAFSRPRGRVLDIGCGPQPLPAYWTSPEGGELIGIDPLPGAADREFHFVQGIGEYLPLPEGDFDQVLLASSLDHALNPRRVLQEARRVLEPGGRLAVWFFFDTEAGKETAAERRKRRLAIARISVRQLKKALHLLLRGDVKRLRARVENCLPARSSVAALAANEPQAAEGLAVPVGAVDSFHFAYCRRQQVLRWLAQVGSRVTDL